MNKKIIAVGLLVVLLSSSITSVVTYLVSRDRSDIEGTSPKAEIVADATSVLPGEDEDSSFDYGSIYDNNGYIKGINALDYVPLFAYNEIRIPNETHVVTDEKLEDEIQLLLTDAGAVLQITDRAVDIGDLVNIDYVGTINGVRFEGGSTNGVGTDVEAGSQGQYIGEFLDKIVGVMPGESVTIVETFPDDYQQEDFQGKTATFETTINYIHGTQEFNDEFVMANLNASFGWTTAEEARLGMREKMSEVYVQNYVQELISTMIAEQVDLGALPEFLTQYYEDSMLQYYRDSAEYYNLDLNTFIQQYVGYNSIEALVEAYRDYNQRDAAYFLIIQAIANDIGLIITDEEVEQYIVENENADVLRENIEHYGVPYLKGGLMYERVFNYILDKVVLE